MTFARAVIALSICLGALGGALAQSSSSQSSEELYVVLLSTSKFWFNYRQGTNVLLIYQTLKRFGVPDSNILLMIPENNACNPRNNDPGVVSPYDGSSTPNVFRDVEVDYKHSDVEVKSFYNILRGRYPRYLPQSKRIQLKHNARLLMYITGHGGNGYIKLQDTDVMLDEDLMHIMSEAEQNQLYNEALMLSDSCSAVTIFEKMTAQRIFAVGSSSRDEKSYSHGRDSLLHQSKVDRFSLINYEFLNNDLVRNPDGPTTLADLMKKYTVDILKGHYGIVNTFTNKNESQILLKDFFTQKKKYAVRTASLKSNEQQLERKSPFAIDFLDDSDSNTPKTNTNAYAQKKINYKQPINPNHVYEQNTSKNSWGGK